MTNVIALRPGRRLPGFVTLCRDSRVEDLTREDWADIEGFEAGLDRVRRLVEFIEARVAEVTDPMARAALRGVSAHCAGLLVCSRGVLPISRSGDGLSVHWPGAFGEECGECDLAEAAEDTLRAMAAAWSDHADYGAAVSA